MSQHSLDDENHITLCEVLDRVLNKGVVVHGDVMISGIAPPAHLDRNRGGLGRAGGE
jgi:hypothetical protein